MRNGIQHARYYVIDNEEDGRGLLALLEATGVSLQCFVRIKLSPASKQGVPLGYVPILIENFKLRTKARICGFHVHAGWNVQPVDSYTRSFALLRQYSEILQSLDNGDVAYNLGGSFTELSETNLNERLLLYRSLIPEYVSKIYFEPGRAIVGDAGSIMCRVTMVDTSTNRLAIDSCAYVYRLTAGTPRAEIIGGLIKQKNLWALLGVWPSETDILPIVELTGEPRAGDLLLLKNLGAYTHGLEHQFDPEGRYLRIIW
jgi:diaminopimelate decarboxylase